MSGEGSRDQKETKMLTDLPENKNVAAGDFLKPCRVKHGAQRPETYVLYKVI